MIMSACLLSVVESRSAEHVVVPVEDPAERESVLYGEFPFVPHVREHRFRVPLRFPPVVDGGVVEVPFGRGAWSFVGEEFGDGEQPPDVGPPRVVTVP